MWDCAIQYQLPDAITRQGGIRILLFKIGCTLFKCSHSRYHNRTTIGVREYWIVDPKRETVLCYFFEGEDYPQMYTFDDIIPVMIYDGKLEINFADIKDRLI